MSFKGLKLSSFNRISKATLPLAITCMMVMSCQKFESEPEYMSEEASVDLKARSERGVDNIDREAFSQVSKLSKTLREEKIWNGYNVNNYHIYLIHTDRNDNPINGYIINPHKNFSGMTKLSADDSFGLDVYEYNEVKDHMMNAINQSNGTYDLNYEFEGELYQLMAYSDYLVESRQLGTLLVHEVFHTFQRNWAWIWGANQDSDNYPLSKELVALQVLSLSALEGLPSETNVEELRERLKMYLAIRMEEMRLDFSSAKLVRSMANTQERSEGTANFVEEYSYHLTYDKSYNFVSFDPHKIEDRYWHGERYIRDYFTWSIWYNTGASVVYCLKKLGVNIETELSKAQTPFDVAEAFINLTDSEKQSYLPKPNNRTIGTGACRLLKNIWALFRRQKTGTGNMEYLV